jgi:Heparinase II/III-like protein/Heparinase II C-terminal domain
MEISLLTGVRRAALVLLLVVQVVAQEDAGWVLPDPPMVPPPGHPRVFLRTADLPTLRQRFINPRFAAFATAIRAGSEDSWDGTLEAGPANFTPRIHTVIEACALRAMLEEDPGLGRRAVDLLCRVLPLVTFPETQDVTRDMGATITTAALVYDWCYVQTSETQRALIRREMKRIAKMMEVGYPPRGASAVTGHTGEAQILRDQLVGGIAVYDEDPEMYRYAAGRIFAEIVPARNFIYPSHWHHQGSSYGPYRLQWELWTTLIFSRMGLPSPFSTEQSQVPYAWIYGRRPDGQVFADGDGGVLFRHLTTPVNSAPVEYLAAAVSRDPVILGWAERIRQDRDRTSSLLGYFLFMPTDVAPLPPDDLPLSRYFPDPAGVMIARTSWATGAEAPCAMAQMKIAPWMFNNHQHLDAGHFQLWYKGALATGSGVYQGSEGGYGSAHFVNYYQRTIAHNTITVTDPDEVFTWQGQTVANDGGQRWPNEGREAPTQEVIATGHRVGRVTGHDLGPDAQRPAFSYLSGDLESYGPKVVHANRSFLFLNLANADHPAALVVYDRIRSARAEFLKTWLLHTPAKPVLAGDRFTARGDSGGRMDGQILAPVSGNIQMAAVGGQGREFTVGARNYPQIPKRDIPLASIEGAGWRIEISPIAARQDDRFLVVLQVGDDRPGYTPLAVTEVMAPELTGLRIADRVALFPTGDGLLTKGLTCTIPGTGTCLLMLAGVTPGTWEITQDGKRQEVAVAVASCLLQAEVASGPLAIHPRP